MLAGDDGRVRQAGCRARPARPAADGNKSMIQPGSVRSATRISPAAACAPRGSVTTRTRPRRRRGSSRCRACARRPARAMSSPCVDTCSDVDRAAGLEAVGRRVVSPIALELRLPHGDQPTQVGGRRRPLDETEHLLDFEVEDVARIVERRRGVKLPAQLDDDQPDAAEQPCPLEAQVLAIAHPGRRVPEHPANASRRNGCQHERRRTRASATERASTGCRNRRRASTRGRRPNAGAGCGSSRSVGLSSFSSSRQRSPNLSRYAAKLGRGTPARRSLALDRSGAPSRSAVDERRPLPRCEPASERIRATRFGADHPALAAQQVVAEGPALLAPLRRQLAAARRRRSSRRSRSRAARPSASDSFASSVAVTAGQLVGAKRVQIRAAPARGRRRVAA